METKNRSGRKPKLDENGNRVNKVRLSKVAKSIDGNRENMERWLKKIEEDKDLTPGTLIEKITEGPERSPFLVNLDNLEKVNPKFAILKEKNIEVNQKDYVQELEARIKKLEENQMEILETLYIANLKRRKKE